MMQKNLYYPLLLFILPLMLIQGCSDTCETSLSVIYYEPVYTSIEELRNSTGLEQAREVQNAGKIYYIDNHLLINEPNEGIHIIDNSDPENPQNTGFLNIPGNFDLAAVDGYLYADSYVDLVVFDISDIASPSEVERLENIFPNYNSYGYYLSEFGIVTGWKEVEHISDFKADCEGSVTPWGYNYKGGIALHSDVAFNATEALSPANPGIGGSMARFTITNSHLYMVDQSEMRVIDITTPSNPVESNKIHLGNGIETIFPHGNKLFIGANNGMSIYDVSLPKNPEHLSTFSHVRSCDPVVTDGRYAYVTLRSGSQCEGFTNQLDVLDIEDPTSPTLVKSYPMYNPHGLSISNGRLFVCDGDEGLKIYEAYDVQNIDKNLIKQYNDIHAYDVIVVGCLVMLIGNDGLHQYSCSDFEGDIQHLSHIPFGGDQ